MTNVCNSNGNLEKKNRIVAFRNNVVGLFCFSVNFRLSL